MNDNVNCTKTARLLAWFRNVSEMEIPTKQMAIQTTMVYEKKV
jgi:hypothetical protein